MRSFARFRFKDKSEDDLVKLYVERNVQRKERLRIEFEQDVEEMTQIIEDAFLTTVYQGASYVDFTVPDKLLEKNNWPRVVEAALTRVVAKYQRFDFIGRNGRLYIRVKTEEQLESEE